MQKEQTLVSNDHITGQYEIFLSKLKPKRDVETNNSDLCTLTNDDRDKVERWKTMNNKAWRCGQDWWTCRLTWLTKNWLQRWEVASQAECTNG